MPADAAAIDVEPPEHRTEIGSYSVRNEPLSIKYRVPDTLGFGNTADLAGWSTFPYTYTYPYTAGNSAGQTTVTYPAAGGMASETVTTGYNYFLGGKPTTLNTNYPGATSYVTGTTYNAWGALSNRTTATATTTGPATLYQEALYDGLGRLSVQRTSFGSIAGSTFPRAQDQSYVYDNRGNIIQSKDWTGSASGIYQGECFGYAARSRLTQAFTASFATQSVCTAGHSALGPTPYNETYTYNPIGNMLSKTGQGNYTYAASVSGCATTVSRPHAVSATSANAGVYTYDCNGSMLTRTTTAGSATNVWDVYGRLSQTTTAAGATRDIYNADGARVLRRNPDGTTNLYLPNSELKSTPGAAGTAPAYRDVAQASNGIAGSTFMTVNRPTATATGDLIVASVTASGGSGSTVYSEGFETGVSDWTPWYGPATVAQTGIQFRSGTKSLQLNPSGGDSNGRFFPPVSVGTATTVSLWTKGSGTAYPYIQYFNSSWGSNGSVSQSPITLSPTTWTQWSATYTPPAGTAYVQIAFQNTATNPWWIDDATVTTGGTATPTTITPNETGWTPVATGVRDRLQRLGVLRESGHEHFRGCVTVPILDADGVVVQVFGRTIGDDARWAAGSRRWLPAARRGVWNLAGIDGEVIVTDGIVDALSCWSYGFESVTAADGPGGFDDELTAALVERGVKRVVVAFENTAAGDQGAREVAARLGPHGVSVARAVLPHDQGLHDGLLGAKHPRDLLGRMVRQGHGTRPRARGRRRHRPATSPTANGRGQPSASEGVRATGTKWRAAAANPPRLRFRFGDCEPAVVWCSTWCMYVVTSNRNVLSGWSGRVLHLEVCRWS